MSQSPAGSAEPSIPWTQPMLAAFFNQAPFYTAILSPEGVILEVGRRALDACGYIRAEVLNRPFCEAGWWRGMPDVQARLKTAIAACARGESFTASLPALFANGTSHWVSLSLSPVMENGRLIQIITSGTDITEQVQAEAEVVTVRRRLDSALIAAEIATYEWDVVSDRLHGDQNLEPLFGIKLDADGAAPLGRFMEVIHPDDRQWVGESVLRSVSTGEDFEEDYRVLLADGTERTINSRGRMRKNDAGRVVSFSGVLMDVTERKRAEREREAIADRLQRLTAIHETVLSATNDFAYVFDLEGHMLYANRPLLKVYGRTLDQVAGKTLHELGYPAWHVEMHLREIAQVITTREPIQGEVPFRGESGLSGIYDYIFTPVFGADGKVVAVAGTTRDVSERKRGEARDRLLVAVDDATRPLTDPQEITQAAARTLGEHLGVNRCAYADVEDDANTFNLIGDFNRDVPSIVGRYRFDQFGEECLRLMRAGLPYVVTDSETDPRTEAVREAYRATQIRAVICVPLTKARRFVAAMAVHTNIVRNWIPAEIEALAAVANRSWESIERSRVVRVLAESEQRQIRLREEAVRASRAKDEFLATLSHELRTPLNPVLLLASEGARDPTMSPATRQAFEVIRKNVELEARLIDDLLDLTSIVRGKLAIRKQAHDLHAIVDDALTAVRPEFEAKGIVLDAKLAAQAAVVFVDEVRLAQVFINLLKNAAKFTPEKGSVALVTAREGRSAVIRLTDSGIGLTSAELERIFDAFEQGDHAADDSTRRFGGLGLGLAISRRLTELHDGELTAVSAGRGRGASFIVRLPLHDASDAMVKAGDRASPAAAEPLRAGGARILLVEDHEATRHTLELLLQRRGYVVAAAASVREARALAAGRDFDLVVSDIGLPDGDGADLMRDLRDQRRWKGVALTGYGMDEDIARYRAAGFIAQLTKPIRVEALENVLREALAGPR